MKNFDNIELVKFPVLDEIDGAILEKAILRFVEKTRFDDSSNLVVAYKEYAKGGLRKQHELKARVIINGKTIVASEIGWKFLETTQKLFKKLEKEVLRCTSN